MLFFVFYMRRRAIYDEIMRQGFVLETHNNGDSRDNWWAIGNFTKEKTEFMPELDLTVALHPVHGSHVVAYSICPWDRKYYAYMDKPARVEEAIRFLTEYMRSVRKGTR